jgi:Fe-S cluster assembly iron-binding protein IscA
MAIQISKHAWKKIGEICTQTKTLAFIFSVSSGGCNGFNYILNPIKHDKIKKLTNPQEKKFGITIIKNDINNNIIIVDPLAEMHLMGTKIDYQYEDFSNKIYESKFIFTIDKSLASSCGCGTSFMPKNM